VKPFLKRSVTQIAHWAREQRHRLCVAPEQEIVYRGILLRLLAGHGLKDEYTPVKNAANHSLLYLIARIVTELKVDRVLELGAGETTVLLDRLKAACGHPQTVVTVEHDETWVGIVQQRVAHKLLLAPLRSRAIGGREAAAYDFNVVAAAGQFDLLVVDGPRADDRRGRYNRLGALDLIDMLPPDGAAIVIDDAERPGESYLASLMFDALAARGLRPARSQTNAAKRQEVIAYGSKRAAVYF
jgi:hypothetical protein